MDTNTGRQNACSTADGIHDGRCVVMLLFPAFLHSCIDHRLFIMRCSKWSSKAFQYDRVVHC